ncbi:hypothetical protein BC834DRAFT_974011 [Gloeopeniophorella convolvens]|nr:hypothetical protein BC834DRAFT_974011 [Gloeopeniophorella convolvens]
MLSHRQTSIVLVLVALLSVASIFLTHSLYVFVRNVQFGRAVMVKEYSMQGDDTPPFFPLTLKRKLRMVVEETEHYAPHGPGAKDEWRFEMGFGFDGAGRVGSDNRTFAVALYHQEHCLRYFQTELTDHSPNKKDFPHHHHCFDYLRREALCHPDLTLERGDFTKRDFDVDREGATHVCRDFETAWDINTDNWLGWYYFLNSTRLPTYPSLDFD